MDPDRPAFGVLLRRYRLSAGLTQQALADRAGLSLRGLSDLERGLRRAPYADTVDRLLHALELGPSDRAILITAGRRMGGVMESAGIADWLGAQVELADPEVQSGREPSADGKLLFVGRKHELAMLEAFLKAASHGGGGFVLMSGEPGIGKTRLALELAKRAESHSWRVLYGRATAVEGAPAYLPILEALRGYVDACSADALRIQLGEAASHVALLLPAIRHRLLEIPPSSASVDESMRYRLLASLSEFLLAIAAASKSGLLLILEDLHWADASTLLLLKLLASKLAGSALVILGTHRSAEADLTSVLADVLADLSRTGSSKHIALPPLSAAEVSTLLAGLHGGPIPTEVADTLYAKTEGNPFFLASILHQLVSTGCNLGDAKAVATHMTIPQDVRWVIRNRLSRLSPGANELLRTGAVVGDWFHFDVVAEMVGTSIDSTIEALEEALAADLLRPERSGYRFSHALIRETLYDSLSLPRRQRLHFAAASAMERLNKNAIDSHVPAIATHYRLAGSAADHAKVIDYSIRAGEAARAVFAWEQVAAFWEAALDSMEASGTDFEVRARHLERLAEVMQILGWDFYAKRIVYLEMALEVYRRTGASESATRLHIELAWSYSNANASTVDLPRSVSHFQAAEALLSERPDAKLGSLLYGNLANACAWSARTRDGLAACKRALSMDAQLVPDHQLSAPVAEGWHLVSAGKIAQGLAELEHAWEAASGRGRIESFTASAYRSDCGFYLADPRDAHEWRRRELANSQLAPARRRAILGGMAAACTEAGDLEQAARLQAEADTSALDILVVLFPGPLIAFRRGDWERARTLWSQAFERHRRTGSRWCEVDFGCWLARVYRVQGEISAAEAVLCEALAIGTQAPSQLIEMWTRPELAILCSQTDRLPEAERHLVRCRAILAGGENWRGLAGRVALAEALIASVLSNWEIAEREFDRALSIFRRWTVPWNEAEALSAWGCALAGTGRQPLAVEKFNAARGIYQRIGAGEAWLRHVDGLELNSPR